MGTRRLLPLALVGLIALGFATRVSAAPGDTTLTVTITGGALSITVPASAGLGSVAQTVGGEVVTGSLGPVTVSDARSTGSGAWTTSVISTAFTPSAGPTIGAAFVDYASGPVTLVSGTASVTTTNLVGLTGVANALTATGGSPNNSVTWNPTITVRIPQGTAAGLYTATITHSVS